MLKETEIEETIGFLSHFYHRWHFNWGGPGPPAPPGYAYVSMIKKLCCQRKSYTVLVSEYLDQCLLFRC